jgi:nitrile hydratase accessory protein
LSRPDAPLGHLKRRDDEPIFNEPWQAQVMGMAEILVAKGVIPKDGWAAALGTELRDGAAAGMPDDAETYYRAVLAAIQKLLHETGVTARDEVDVRESEWRHAYLNTPHGMPVELGITGSESSQRARWKTSSKESS